MASHCLVVMAVLFIFNTAALAQGATGVQDTTSVGEGQKWNVSCSGYFQVKASTGKQGFSLPFSKFFLDGRLGKKLSATLELRPFDGNPIQKAYIGYSLNPLATILAGQISNPIKYIEPQPEENKFTSYALYQHYVANPDDIGLAVYGERKTFLYYVCLVNGTGRNTPEDNQAKDVAGYISFTPLSAFCLEIAGQTGKQPTFLRQAGFIRGTFKPLSALEIQLASMGRTDLKEWGWYASSSYLFSWLSLNTRLHRTTQKDNQEWTVGIQANDSDFKFTVDASFGRRQHPSFAAVMQLYIKGKE
ncbi:MAG: hypothetical protein WC619_06365 [Patescibacteria group bacterium]